MADITSSVAEQPVQRSDDSLGRWVSKKITPVSDGVDSKDTHNIITLPANSFVAEGLLVITTKMVSTSNNGKIQFAVGSGTIGGQMTADGNELDANDVIRLVPNDQDTGGGEALYVTSPDTIDMVVGTNPITAGAFTVFFRIVELIQE